MGFREWDLGTRHKLGCRRRLIIIIFFALQEGQDADLASDGPSLLGLVWV